MNTRRPFSCPYYDINVEDSASDSDPEFDERVLSTMRAINEDVLSGRYRRMLYDYRRIGTRVITEDLHRRLCIFSEEVAAANAIKETEAVKQLDSLNSKNINVNKAPDEIQSTSSANLCYNVNKCEIKEEEVTRDADDAKASIENYTCNNPEIKSSDSSSDDDKDENESDESDNESNDVHSPRFNEVKIKKEEKTDNSQTSEDETSSDEESASREDLSRKRNRAMMITWFLKFMGTEGLNAVMDVARMQEEIYNMASFQAFLPTPIGMIDNRLLQLLDATFSVPSTYIQDSQAKFEAALDKIDNKGRIKTSLSNDSLNDVGRERHRHRPVKKCKIITLNPPRKPESPVPGPSAEVKPSSAFGRPMHHVPSQTKLKKIDVVNHILCKWGKSPSQLKTCRNFTAKKNIKGTAASTKSAHSAKNKTVTIKKTDDAGTSGESSAKYSKKKATDAGTSGENSAKYSKKKTDDAGTSGENSAKYSKKKATDAGTSGENSVKSSKKKTDDAGTSGENSAKYSKKKTIDAGTAAVNTAKPCKKEKRKEIRSIGKWTEYLSSSGTPFYYNKEKDETQWEKPPEFLKGGLNLSKKRTADTDTNTEENKKNQKAVRL